MKKFQLFLVDKSEKIYDLCSEKAKKIYLSPAKAMILTIIFAIFGGYHIGEIATCSKIYAFLFGLATVLGILILDWLVFNAFSNIKKMKIFTIPLRVIITVCLSTLFSMPFITMLYHNKIKQQLAINKVNIIKKIDLDYQAVIDSMMLPIKNQQKTRDSLQKLVLDESEGLAANKQKGFGKQFDYKNQLLKNSESQLIVYHQKAMIDKAEFDQQFTIKRNAIESNMSSGYLANLSALFQLLMSDKPESKIMWGCTIVIFIILLILTSVKNIHTKLQ